MDCSAVPQPCDDEAPPHDEEPQCSAAASLAGGLAAFEAGLRRRGPDGTDTARFELRGGGRLELLASLLQLRGSSPSAAILRHPDGSALCFNGAPQQRCAVAA